VSHLRCIKPNATKMPGAFEGKLVYEQLKYSGIFEAVTIRRQVHRGASSVQVCLQELLIGVWNSVCLDSMCLASGYVNLIVPFHRKAA
jgi:hypothetical protein